MNFRKPLHLRCFFSRQSRFAIFIFIAPSMMIFFRPQLVRFGLPAIGVSLALFAQMLGAFRCLQIGGVGAALRHQFRQDLRILQHGAGPQVVAVEGLSLAVELEQRLLQALQEALFPNIGAGVMDEHAGLHIACGVDVAVDAPARHAAAGELAVVLKVDAVQLLAAGDAADLTDAILHVGALLRRQQQGGVGVQSHGHVVEVPGEHAALGDEQVEELVAGDDLVVPAGITDGDAEGDAMAAHEIHGVQHLLEVSLSAAAVVGLLEAFHADGHEEIAHPQHILTECLVDKGAVGEGVERHITVLFAQADDVLLPQQRLAAGEKASVGAQLFGLGQHTIHFLKGQALLVAVFCRPAAGAVHVAGGGGIHQNEPGHIDVVLGGVFLCRLIAPKSALIGHIGQEGLENVGVIFPNEPLGVVRPLSVGILGDHAQRRIGAVAPGPLVDLLDEVNELLGKIAHILCLSFFQHGVKDRFKRLSLGCMGDFFGDAHSSIILSVPYLISCVLFFCKNER